MNTPIPPELFAQRPVRSELPVRESKPVLRIGRLVALLAVLAVFVGAGFASSVFLNAPSPEPGEIPHVQAEYPVKTRPENPGGIDIPHRNVEIFERLEDKRDPGVATSAVEHLLPAPESPQPVEAASSPPAVTPEAPLPLEEIATTPAPSVAEPPPPAMPIAEAAAPIVAEAPKQTQKTEPAPIKKPIQTARLPETLFTQTPQNAAQEKPEKGTTRVQFASLPDETAAKRDVAVLSNRFASALFGASLEIVRADIPGKGIYHRIVTEPVSEATAKKICAAVKTAKGSCLLLK